MQDESQNKLHGKPESKDDRNDRLLLLTRDLLLSYRGEHIAGGNNRMIHWDKIQSAVLIASKTSPGTSEWLSVVRSQMQLTAPTTRSAELACELVEATRGDSHFLRMLARRCAHLMSMMRIEADRRRTEREAREAEELANRIKGAAGGDSGASDGGEPN